MTVFNDGENPTYPESNSVSDIREITTYVFRSPTKLDVITITSSFNCLKVGVRLAIGCGSTVAATSGRASRVDK